MMMINSLVWFIRIEGNVALDKSGTSIQNPGFVQKTRPKNQGLFKDFPAPNNFIPGPFYFH